MKHVTVQEDRDDCPRVLISRHGAGMRCGAASCARIPISPCSVYITLLITLSFLQLHIFIQMLSLIFFFFEEHRHYVAGPSLYSNVYMSKQDCVVYISSF